MARTLLKRAMATLTSLKQTSPIQYTPEGAVSISYQTLFKDPLSLGPSIGIYITPPLERQADRFAEQAFGSHPKSLGIIIVRDLPQAYVAYRERLLKLAYKFATLDEASREKYSHAKSYYSFGWSHGKVRLL